MEAFSSAEQPNAFSPRGIVNWVKSHPGEVVEALIFLGFAISVSLCLFGVGGGDSRWFWGGLAILLFDFFIWDDDEYPDAFVVGCIGLVCLTLGIWAGLPSDNLILIDRWGTVERASDAGVLRSPFKRLRRLSEEGTVETSVISTTADGHRIEATAIWSWRVTRDVAVQHLVDDDGWGSPRKTAEIQWAVESILSHHNADAIHWSNQDLQLEMARAIEVQLSSDNAWLQTFGFKRLRVIRTDYPP